MKAIVDWDRYEKLCDKYGALEKEVIKKFPLGAPISNLGTMVIIMKESLVRYEEDKKSETRVNRRARTKRTKANSKSGS